MISGGHKEGKRVKEKERKKRAAHHRSFPDGFGVLSILLYQGQNTSGNYSVSFAEVAIDFWGCIALADM